jgi:hypothetical protein
LGFATILNMTRVIFLVLADLVGDNLKKTFVTLVAITTVVFIISLLYASSPPTKTAIAATQPGPTSPDWYLNVTGLVENPLILNWTTILAMPKTTVEAPIICVDTSIKSAEANWTGVKLRTVLEQTHPSQDAIKIAFYAADGYTTDLTVQTAMRDDILLGYEKDGAPLNDLRLIVPDKWGYKWISQLTRIELVNYDFLGGWESFGYSDEADITLNSTSTNPATPEPTVPPLPLPTTTTSPPTTTTPSPTPYSPSSSEPPITSPTPIQPTPTPPTTETSKEAAIPPETVYAVSALVIGVLLVGALAFVRKRTKS